MFPIQKFTLTPQVVATDKRPNLLNRYLYVGEGRAFVKKISKLLISSEIDGFIKLALYTLDPLISSPSSNVLIPSSLLALKILYQPI